MKGIDRWRIPDTARPGRTGAFATRLLSWYDRHQRDLPWRNRPDPWAIWVSEVMLQQTRVETVLGAYRRFMHRYPRPADWASVGDRELLEAWRGLGYYRRARLLRQGAREVVARYGGQVPSDPQALGRLPGIGSYTRGAIASIAFGRPQPAIDGNVERVAARHRGITTDVKRQPARGRVLAAVQEWLDHDRPGDFNQALMELGATVCTPRSPKCPNCPVAGDCEALARDLVVELPRRSAKKPAIEVCARAALVQVGSAGVLAFEIPEGEVNAGQIELPGPGILNQAPLPRHLADGIRRRFGVRVRVEEEPLVSVRHGITHHRIRLSVHAARLRGGPGALRIEHPADPSVPWTTASRKVFRRLPAEG